MSFSTFGDGASLPRLQGLPDVFDGLDSAMAEWRKLPDVYAALRSEYVTFWPFRHVTELVPNRMRLEMSLLAERT